jgi:hypothetical protein
MFGQGLIHLYHAGQERECDKQCGMKEASHT